MERGGRAMGTFKPKLGLSREVEGVAGAQTGNTVRASLLQRPEARPWAWDEGLLASTGYGSSGLSSLFAAR